MSVVLAHKLGFIQASKHMFRKQNYNFSLGHRTFTNGGWGVEVKISYIAKAYKSNSKQIFGLDSCHSRVEIHMVPTSSMLMLQKLL